MSTRQDPLVVIGAGIVGLATARELQQRLPRQRVLVLEGASAPALGQTARNSGVVHAGIYYRPASLKARLCVEGARLLAAHCERRDLPFERCGKVIVARDERERQRLEELLRRARANGVRGVEIVDRRRLAAIEPHCVGVAALWSPTTAVTDFRAVAHSLADELRQLGGELRTWAQVEAVAARPTGAAGRSPLTVALASGERLAASFVVACAGGDADRLAAASGLAPQVRILPFRGSYRTIRAPSSRLVRALIYPVPDPQLPFLGVHLSRHVDGVVTLGPTALPWPLRGLPGGTAVSTRRARLRRHLVDSARWPGTRRALWRYRRAGMRELSRWLCPRLLATDARSYVPALDPRDFAPGPAGIRAQAVARDGTLVDDFLVSEGPGMLHVLNAPSPAATSALALARLIADRVAARLR